MPTHPNHAIIYWGASIKDSDYHKLVSTGLLADLMLDIKSDFEGYEYQLGAVFSKIIPKGIMQEIFVKIDIFAQEADLNIILLSKVLCLYGNYLKNFPIESSENWWKYVYAGTLFIPSDFQFEFVNQKKRMFRLPRLFSTES